MTTTTPTTTVYRVEDESGLGPYRNRDIYLEDWYESRNFGHNDTAHPGPARDGLEITSRLICGFMSMEQLHQWFTDGELKNLEALGVNVVEVQALSDTIQCGKKQIIFERAEEDE